MCDRRHVEKGTVSGRAHHKKPVNEGRCAIHCDGRAHRRDLADREFRVKVKWWAARGSNLRPPACKAGRHGSKKPANIDRNRPRRKRCHSKRHSKHKKRHTGSTSRGPSRPPAGRPSRALERTSETVTPGPLRPGTVSGRGGSIAQGERT